MNQPPEWVKIAADGRLAMVQERTELGVLVQPPFGGRPLQLPVEDVVPFDPTEYPRQLSAAERTRIKASGGTPRDEVEKVCNQCLTVKPIADFAPNQARSDGSKIHRPTCIECRAGIDGVINQSTRKDGSVPEEPPLGAFWKCPICEKDYIVGVTVKLVLDHDHLSGHARDYLCDSCNTGLGRFRNGKIFLSNALRYLQTFN